MKAMIGAIGGIVLLAGCGGRPAEDDGALGRTVEPSLRSAAHTAEASHDYKGAAQHWRTLYQRNPGDKAVAVALARAMRYAGMAQQGADLMQDALERLGRDANLAAELGKCYLAAERVGLALKALAEAEQLDQTRWDAPSAIGVALDLQGRHAEAEAAYRRALALSPDNPEIVNNLALSLALSGKLDEALVLMGRAADHPKAGLQMRQNLALLTALKGNAAEAARLAGRDLPPDMARANAEIFRHLANGVR